MSGENTGPTRAFFFEEFFGGPEHDHGVQDSFCAFLERIDNALQEFTLGISPSRPTLRHLSCQEYRVLLTHNIGGGTAEPQNPLLIDLPAIKLMVRRIRHKQRGAGIESVLMPSLKALPSGMKEADAAILAGPACLRYPGIPEDYKGDTMRRHYAWPTAQLRISMEGLVPGLFWLFEPQHHSFKELYIHHGRRSKYLIQLVQQTDIKEYAEAEPHRLRDKNNSIIVRWNVLFWREPIPGMPPPEAAVAFLCLRYVHLPPPPPNPSTALQPHERGLAPRPIVFGPQPPRAA
ncbi:hypothetical protein BMF94_3410 [Rhodotorula taiwanensis]|uniref:Uncharacterized protein n=1 Tax=Rhodotorula taiwanensis TaxID=741276 RepID=A0A2S5B9M3_9BASI|nr:hypothetical protein BMF94_3410 [Rhodotorula taiwanensis]